MDPTEEQKQRLKNQFAARRRSQFMGTAPVLILLLLLVTADQDKGLVLGFIPVFIFFLIFLIALLALILFSLKNWRCPACNKYLGKRSNPKVCPKCGAELG